MADLDKDEKTVTIESDAFSTYVLCYTDRKDADTRVLAPVEKPLTGNKGNDELTTQLPSAGKTEENKKPADKEKEASNNMIYYFLLPIAVLLTVCIAFVIRIKHSSNKK